MVGEQDTIEAKKRKKVARVAVLVTCICKFCGGCMGTDDRSGLHIPRTVHVALQNDHACRGEACDDKALDVTACAGPVGRAPKVG